MPSTDKSPAVHSTDMVVVHQQPISFVHLVMIRWRVTKTQYIHNNHVIYTHIHLIFIATCYLYMNMDTKIRL